MAKHSLDEETTKKVIRQVEFYFSDSNLPRDDFLSKTVNESEDGMVSLALLCSFNRMRKHLKLADDTKPADVKEETVKNANQFNSIHNNHFCIITMKSLIFGIAFLLLNSSLASDTNPPYPKAFSDFKESIVKGLGFNADDFKVTGFDPREAQVGHSVEYQFDVEIDDKVVPFKLLEDTKRWDYVDLPIFRVEEENGLVEKRVDGNGLPVLAPFQLAGPMEIWVQDAKDMRLSLPHDVDAGVLKKVVLADGAVVTVKGARSVSLRHPLTLPLPLNRTQNGFAAGLLTLAEHLRHASRGQDAPLLSLRIVGPSSLEAPSSASTSSNNRLKLKRLAPGLVELSSQSKAKLVDTSLSTVDLQEEAPTLLTPTQFTALWPLASLNGSNANLLGFERLLSSVLGPKANEKVPSGC